MTARVANGGRLVVGLGLVCWPLLAVTAAGAGAGVGAGGDPAFEEVRQRRVWIGEAGAGALAPAVEAPVEVSVAVPWSRARIGSD
ncbi:MAG: hypothetical protein ACRDZ3_11370, partial [Acidimicrobiia bacterium]